MAHTKNVRTKLIAATSALLAVGVVSAPSSQAALPKSKCALFPANNVWHSDISRLPVNKRSSAWLSSSNAKSRRLHPDFGPSDTSVPYGIPYEETPANRSKVSVTFNYADESDKGPYPFASTTPIEGGQSASGDRHGLMVDPSCRLYELYDAHYKSGGGSTAGSGAIWNLKTNALRPSGWTSADAAGLPILPGLLRLDEVKAGKVDHAVRFTVAKTDKSFVWPARHQAGSSSNRNLPPMGARFRLKASYSLSGLRPDTQVILKAFKKYGLILADNGSDWYFGGTSEKGWPTPLLDQLKQVPASAFEAVDASSLMVSANSAEARKK